MRISFFIKVLLLVALSVVSNAKELNQVELAKDKKSKQYYKSFKKEWDKLPVANKKRIIEAYHVGKKLKAKQNMGLTLAATRFLENKGMASTFDNKDSINKNVHNGYVTYDCGAFGINTMTYLQDTGNKTKDPKKHIAACKKLANDKNLNTKMSLKVYTYALNRFDNNLVKAWNYYNTGKEAIINDRIYKMKGAVMLLKQEIDG